MNRVQTSLTNRDLPNCPNQIGRRSAPRLRLAIPAKLVSLSGSVRCILIDLSLTGAQVGLERPVNEGADVFLQIAGLEPFGSVVRQAVGPNGGKNGIVFEKPLEKDDVLFVRAYAERYEEEEKQFLINEARNWVMGTAA